MAQKKVGNPFLEENILQGGGGLWDGKNVTILRAKTMIDRLTRGDGSVVLDEKTGEPAVRHCLEIMGVSEDSDAERRETYSAGSIFPTPDGEGFQLADGTPAMFHKNCEMTKFAAYLRDSGFDVTKLWDEKTTSMKASALVGAQFLFVAEAKFDKDGKAKVNKKGYTENRFFPQKFLGFKAGVGGTAPAPVNTELHDKAVGTVLQILSEAGKKVGRAELVRKVSAALAGDSDSNKVIALVTRDDFHNGDVPWTRDSTGYTL